MQHSQKSEKTKRWQKNVGQKYKARIDVIFLPALLLTLMMNRRHKCLRRMDGPRVYSYSICLKWVLFLRQNRGES